MRGVRRPVITVLGGLMDQMIDKPGKAGTVIPAIGVIVIPIKTGLAALTLWMLL
jgi:hypothetical protein